MSTRTDGAYLNDLWRVGAAHALYIHDGHWYHQLRRFPGALFDRNGYIVFATEKEYRACAHLNIGKQISIRKPGISAISGYIRVVPAEDSKLSPFRPPALDLDIHTLALSALEGRRRLVMHLDRERNQTLIRNKKKMAESLDCEVCGFSFRRVYGSDAADYCEVHHLLPLSELEQTTETRLEDLAILCANCHRVVHLSNPPYTLDEVRGMLTRPSSRKRLTARPTRTRARASRLA
jgi:hypothetical protein